MIYPPIDALLEKIDSKYSLVSVAAKRARQLQLDEMMRSSLEDAESVKNVGIALEEINADLLTFSNESSSEGNEDN